MDERPMSNEESQLNIDFTTVCRICLKHNCIKPFQQDLMNLYTRLLNITEVLSNLMSLSFPQLSYF